MSTFGVVSRFFAEACELPHDAPEVVRSFFRPALCAVLRCSRISIDHQREIRMQSEGIVLIPAIKNAISVRVNISYCAVYLLRG
jgi:hypothetical protein